MKNKVLNTLIVMSLIIIVGIIGQVVYARNQAACELYNENIVNFIVDTIKGDKTLQDIDSLDADDALKNSLKEYYNKTFYSEEDLVLVFEGVSKVESNLQKGLQLLREIKDTGYLTYNGKRQEMMDIAFLYGEPDVVYDYELFTEKEIEELYLFGYTVGISAYSDYNQEVKYTDGNFVLKDDNLYLSVRDYQNYCLQNIYTLKYGDIFVDISDVYIDKRIKQLDSESVDEIKIITVKEKSKSEIDYILRDDLNNCYDFTAKLKGNKIENFIYMGLGH